ncbi:MAG TPA: hypothetical protein VHP58_04095 [Alphaproteobacteria bacterium]|nr:hypothetical protein [Alphaproteobacteria bacterium]
MFLLPDSMFTAGNPLRDMYRKPAKKNILLNTFRLAPGIGLLAGLGSVSYPAGQSYQGQARRRRESTRSHASNYREILFKSLESLGNPTGGVAETVSPWKKFDTALAKLVKAEGYSQDGRRYKGLSISLPALPRHIQRKVLKRTNRYNQVRVYFNQRHWA